MPTGSVRRWSNFTPGISQQAREAATASGLAHVEVRTADAGETDSYQGAVPAEVVLLVGIFGNIGDNDLDRAIQTAPEFCRPGATPVWSRGRDQNDCNDAVRAWFASAGFTELDYVERDTGSWPALGVMRYDGDPRASDVPFAESRPVVVGRDKACHYGHKAARCAGEGICVHVHHLQYEPTVSAPA